jgi:hypothetical protein
MQISFSIKVIQCRENLYILTIHNSRYIMSSHVDNLPLFFESKLSSNDIVQNYYDFFMIIFSACSQVLYFTVLGLCLSIKKQSIEFDLDKHFLLFSINLLNLDIQIDKIKVVSI